MSYMVSMADYEGFNGFGQTTPQDIENLNKALAAGYQSPRHDGGSALRVESLEATLRVVTYTQQHIQLWRDIPKLPAYSTSEEYNIQSAYGAVGAGIFTREGELPQAQDASYERRTALVKFMGTQREVTHPMTLVKPAHGNVIALETTNGAIWLLTQLEKALFFADSAVVPQAFDGLLKQILASRIQPQPNYADIRNGVIGEDEIESATERIIEGQGVPSVLYLAPKAHSNLAKQYYPRTRQALPPPKDGVVGMTVTAVETQAGTIPLKSDLFLRAGEANGVKAAPASATARRAPSAPTVLAAAAVNAASKFGTADAGVYEYRVCAMNRFGLSGFAQEPGGVVVAAGDAVTLTITDGGGADPATGYRVYRSKVNGLVGTEEVIAEIPRPVFAATTDFVDLNQSLPGTSTAFLLQMDLQSLSFRQLAPMLKIPLATLAASIRWMQLLYGTPIVYAGDKNFVFLNVADTKIAA